MRDNKLPLNKAKTELVTITPSRQKDKVNIESVHISDCDITSTSTAHNLCAAFDQNMTLHPHVSALVKSCNRERKSRQTYCVILRDSSFSGDEPASVVGFC